MTNPHSTPPQASPPMDAIRHRVHRAILRDRTPGLHFAGHFLDIRYERVEPGSAVVSMPTGRHCTDDTGNVHVGALALLADAALAAGIRAQLGDIGRLATVSIDLRLSGLPCGDRLEAAAHFEGSHAARETQQMSTVVIRGPAGTVSFGAGTFMVLLSSRPIAEHPINRAANDRDAESPALDAGDLSPEESVVIQRSEAALQASADTGTAFLGHFLGYRPAPSPHGAGGEMRNEVHVRNRYGHVQGGLLVGFAATTASVALPPSWTLSGVSAWFTRVADSDPLIASATVIHAGRRTAVVRTQISAVNGSGVLVAVTTHAAAG